MPIIEGARRVHAAIAEYDFAIDAGAVGSINLRGEKIPQGAIVVDALLDVITIPNATVDTLSLGIETAIDLQAAAARNAAPWSTVGAKRLTINATAAPVKTTVERSIAFAINVGVLTQGKFKVIAWYVEAP